MEETETEQQNADREVFELDGNHYYTDSVPEETHDVFAQIQFIDDKAKELRAQEIIHDLAKARLIQSLIDSTDKFEIVSPELIATMRESAETEA